MSYPQYAKNVHQCVKCECTYSEASLRKCEQRDEVLRVYSTVYVCKDEKRCERFKLERAELLEEERRKLNAVSRRLLRGETRVEVKVKAGKLKAVS